jgi:hypothetical protein
MCFWYFKLLPAIFFFWGGDGWVYMGCINYHNTCAVHVVLNKYAYTNV